MIQTNDDNLKAWTTLVKWAAIAVFIYWAWAYLVDVLAIIGGLYLWQWNQRK